MKTAPIGIWNKYPAFRRDYERLPVSGFATIIFEDKSKAKLFLRDFCPRGIGLISPFELSTGQQIEVIAFIPFIQDLIKKKASVAWCNRIKENSWAAGLDFGMDNKIYLANASILG